MSDQPNLTGTEVFCIIADAVFGCLGHRMRTDVQDYDTHTHTHTHTLMTSRQTGHCAMKPRR